MKINKNGGKKAMTLLDIFNVLETNCRSKAKKNRKNVRASFDIL